MRLPRMPYTPDFGRIVPDLSLFSAGFGRLIL